MCMFIVDIIRSRKTSLHHRKKKCDRSIDTHKYLVVLKSARKEAAERYLIIIITIIIIIIIVVIIIARAKSAPGAQKLSHGRY